jgi:hypothetical protein
VAATAATAVIARGLIRARDRAMAGEPVAA